MARADELKIKTTNNRLKNMESRIDKAVSGGKYSCGAGYADMSQDEINYFEEMGFVIKTGGQSDTPWFVISWEK